MVTVPTISAAKNLCRYQNTLMDEYTNKDKKLSVGYAAGGVNKYNKTTEIVYCTTGYLIEKIVYRLRNVSQMLKSAEIEAELKEPIIDFAEAVMIDEAHTQTAENHILCSLNEIHQKPFNLIFVLVLYSPAELWTKTLFANTSKMLNLFILNNANIQYSEIFLLQIRNQNMPYTRILND